MKKIIVNVYDSAAWLHAELIKNGIQFNSEGYPIFKQEFILWEKPEYIYPINHRNSTPDKSKTALCYFMKDELLYKRVANFENDLHLLKGYMGICGFDLSPRIGWNEELQKFNILLSQMITIWFAIHGIKIIPNLRVGDFSTFNSLKGYDQNLPFCMGALGCWKKKVELEDLFYLKTKLMIVRPSSLLIYGKLEAECEEFLEDQGIPFTVYPDFRSVCYEKRGA